MPANVPFTTTWPGTLTEVIPSYLYQEYSDDTDLQAFIAAYNQIAQEYIDWFNQISLPIYTGPMINGDLLDWVGTGLYGVPRPTLSTGTMSTIGPYNTYQYNTLGFNMSRTTSNQSFFVANDDIYKRVLTWDHYKGDGFNFNITWLKRRVIRFVFGIGGIDPPDTNFPSNIGVTVSNGAFTISIRNSALHHGSSAFAACIAGQVLNLPFQFTYTVVLL